MRLWGSRMGKDLDPAFARLNASFSFDRRLYAADIDASLAWARALGRARVLTKSEVDAILVGLEEVRGTLADPAFEPLDAGLDLGDGCGQHAKRGDLGARPVRVPIQLERRF